MKLLLLPLLLCLNSCAALAYQGIQTQDCMTVHWRIAAKGGSVTPDMYEKIAEECRSVFSGRP